jgi:hypothetical protein
MASFITPPLSPTAASLSAPPTVEKPFAPLLSEELLKVLSPVAAASKASPRSIAYSRGSDSSAATTVEACCATTLVKMLPSDRLAQIRRNFSDRILCHLRSIVSSVTSGSSLYSALVETIPSCIAQWEEFENLASGIEKRICSGQPINWAKLEAFQKGSFLKKDPWMEAFICRIFEQSKARETLSSGISSLTFSKFFFSLWMTENFLFSLRAKNPTPPQKGIDSTEELIRIELRTLFLEHVFSNAHSQFDKHLRFLAESLGQCGGYFPFFKKLMGSDNHLRLFPTNRGVQVRETREIFKCLSASLLSFIHPKDNRTWLSVEAYCSLAYAFEIPKSTPPYVLFSHLSKIPTLSIRAGVDSLENFESLRTLRALRIQSESEKLPLTGDHLKEIPTLPSLKTVFFPPQSPSSVSFDELSGFLWRLPSVKNCVLCPSRFTFEPGQYEQLQVDLLCRQGKIIPPALLAQAELLGLTKLNTEEKPVLTPLSADFSPEEMRTFFANLLAVALGEEEEDAPLKLRLANSEAGSPNEFFNLFADRFPVDFYPWLATNYPSINELTIATPDIAHPLLAEDLEAIASLENLEYFMIRADSHCACSPEDFTKFLKALQEKNRIENLCLHKVQYFYKTEEQVDYPLTAGRVQLMDHLPASLHKLLLLGWGELDFETPVTLPDLKFLAIDEPVDLEKTWKTLERRFPYLDVLIVNPRDGEELICIKREGQSSPNLFEEFTSDQACIFASSQDVQQESKIKRDAYKFLAERGVFSFNSPHIEEEI